MRDKKILFADPSIAIRRVAEIAFSDSGVDFRAVSDGAAAMESFVASPPDIVIVDVELPGTNGYQICEIIKDEPATSLIPVLLLASSFVPVNEAAVARCGADGVVLKPFIPVKDLVEKVRSLLDPEPLDPVDDLVSEAMIDAEPTAFYASNDREEALDDIEGLYEQSITETDLDEPSIDEFISEQADSIETHDLDNTLRMADTIGSSIRSDAVDDELIESILVDPPTDDELIDEVRLSPDPSPTFAESEKDVQMRAFDWSPEAIVSDDPIDGSATSQFEPKFTFSDDSTEINGNDRSDIARSMERYDPELIQAVAKAVIDHLSDKVIREVAQESVPRITEQLIREALEAESLKP